MLNSQDGPGHGECDVFVAPDGVVKEVLCYDYGFRSGFGRLYQGGDGEIPKGFFALVRPTAVCSLEFEQACKSCSNLLWQVPVSLECLGHSAEFAVPDLVEATCCERQSALHVGEQRCQK